MALLIALIGAVMVGASAFFACALWMPGRFSLAGMRGRTPRIKEAVVARMELLGHWLPLVRMSNMPAVVRASLRIQPVFAAHGLVLSRRACVAFCAAAFVAGGVLCMFLSGSLMGLAIGCGIVAATLAALVGRREKSQINDAADQMPEVLRALSAALGAGKSLPQAIEYVGRNLGEPMGSEFLKASFEIKGGKTVDEAVADLCVRVTAPGISLLGTALQISQRTGSSLNELFLRTSHMVAGSVSLRRELQVKTSQVRLSAKIVAGMPVLLACFLTLFSPDYRAGIATDAGRACLCVAALLDVGALAIVRRLMRRSLL